MDGIVLDDALVDRLRERSPQFHESAYVFVLAALHYVISGLPAARHISGRELAEGVRDLALERFGPMARTVLEHWGISATDHVGDIVFALVDVGVLIKQDEDGPEDFHRVYDFDEAFEHHW
ncbi:MAG TPA: Minf_1886 family protein [Longimicrobiales bacterium]|nr:Minf_1886 family protein [Longimicrobiales bacterium]